MKRHSLIVDIIIFFIVTLCFVIPPFFVSAGNVNQNIFAQWNFPFKQMVYALSAVVLLCFYGENRKYWLKLFPALISFCALCSVSLFIKYFSIIFSLSSTELDVVLPDSFISWFFCVLDFLFAALYEEVIYRLFFVDALFLLASKKITWKYLNVICEIAGCAVFAFAHMYLGWYAVINAVFAHVVLRVCYKKTNNIWPCVAAHAFYNVISLILL